MASAKYILITNDDNYYCPVFLEQMLKSMQEADADIAMCDMIHSHNNPGQRPQPPYKLFETKPLRGSVDIGCFIARTDLAKKVGFRDKSHDGDATYFEDIVHAAKIPKIVKVDRVLFVHN
jgi:GT2 family glycosyltransferase